MTPREKDTVIAIINRLRAFMLKCNPFLLMTNKECDRAIEEVNALCEKSEDTNET